MFNRLFGTIGLYCLGGFLFGCFAGMFIMATTSPYPEDIPKYCFSEKHLIKTEKPTISLMSDPDKIEYTFIK